MGEDVLYYSLPTTLPRGARKSWTPRCSKEEKFIPSILKFIGTRFDALVEASTQVPVLVMVQMKQFENMGIRAATQNWC